MKKLLSSLALALVTGPLFAQTSLYSETFDGTSHSFTLNTSDVSSTTSGINAWYVNNAYTGGSGSFFCDAFGFDLPFSVPNTPGQPAGIVPNNGKYLHISSVDAVAGGVNGASFLAADGLCSFAENNFAKMNTDVNTTAYDEVTLKFWYACQGSAANYGEVYYSTNGGSTWNIVNVPVASYYNQSSWVQQTITMPVFAGNTTLRFGFRFVNQTTSTAGDPPFIIDNIQILGTVLDPQINVVSVSETAFCSGKDYSLDYEATGGATFTVGNSFSVQFSNEAGSFAAPTTVATVSSTATSGTINFTVPTSLSLGTGYRVRVNSNSPAMTGVDNGVDLTINPSPAASFTYFPDGLTVEFTNTSTDDTDWTWDFGDGDFSTNENPTHTYSASGMYEVIMIASNAFCSDTIKTQVTVEEGVSAISKNEFVSDLNLYPNPASYALNLDLSILKSSDLFIELRSVEGKALASWDMGMQATGKQQVRLDLPQQLANGLYIIGIRNNGEWIRAQVQIIR